MARKKFTTDLTIKAQDTYSCNISKNYTEVFNLNQELDSSDAFVQIVSGSATKGIGTMASAQAILIKNTGNITAEILITMQDWKNSSSVDVVNSVDVGGGGAVTDRSMSMLLPAGEFIYLPNSRIISYASSDADPFESGANAGVGNLDSGKGPVTLNDLIPDGASLNVLIPNFITSFSSTLKTDLQDRINAYESFGLRFDWENA